MLVGGVCVLDEGNRMNEKSWASLAPLLDHRRYVESIVAGITIPAHPDFRACVTMNEDESTYEVPDYILSRLQPTLGLGFPTRDDELAILKYHLPFAESDLLALTVEFLQQAHQLKLDFSPRDGINLLRFAVKRMAQDPKHPIGRDAAWREALLCVLGEEAGDLEDLARKRRRAMGGQHAPMGLGDLFFDPDDPLHPDADDDEEEEDEFDDDALRASDATHEYAPASGRRFSDDQPQGSRSADHPRFGRLRDPGPGGVAGTRVRLPGRPACPPRSRKTSRRLSSDCPAISVVAQPDVGPGRR